MAKSSDCVSYIIFIIPIYHNLLKVVLLAMGLWLNSGEWGIVCAQAGPKWVTIRPVPTLLLRIFGSNTTGGSPTQYCKKAHHITIINFFFCVDNSRFGGIQCLGSMNSPNQCAEGGSSSPSKSTYDHSLLSKPTWPHCLFLTVNLKANEKVELRQIRSQKIIELVIIS